MILATLNSIQLGMIGGAMTGIAAAITFNIIGAIQRKRDNK